MNLITDNPFRIIGILSNITAKEIQRRMVKITAYVRVGKDVSSDYDFPFFVPINRHNDTINKAFADIEQNEDKIIHSLFWFLNLNTIDNTAIEYLANGNKEKSIEIWEKMTEGKEINSKNYSAFNNISTLYLLQYSKEQLKKGISIKIKLIESESFKDFILAVGDETFTVEKNKLLERLIDALLSQFKNKFSTFETLELFENSSETIQKYLSKKFTEEPIYKVENLIKQTQDKRSNNKGNAYRFGKELHQKASTELTLLQSILGKDNLQYKMLIDKLSLELLQCSIDYFNVCHEISSENDYFDEALELAELADQIATNIATINRIQDNIKTLEEMRDKELLLAIELLRSIKEAYEKNKAKILLQVKSQEDKLIYGQTINQLKVDELINNSIDWNVAIKLVKSEIKKETIHKIKKSTKKSTKKSLTIEYKMLVEFLFSKIDNSQRDELEYLIFWLSDMASLSFRLRLNTKPHYETLMNSDKNPLEYYSKYSQKNNHNVQNEFKFKDKAWWILGIAGAMIGGIIDDAGPGYLYGGFSGIIMGAIIALKS